MSFCLKSLLALIVILLISCSAWSSESEVNVSTGKNDQCKDAIYGRLDMGDLKFNDSGHNAFLLNCSLSAVVPEPDEKRAVYDKYLKDKQKLASFLIDKNLDVNYTDPHGSTLLMSVIASNLPEDWKEKTVMTLIEKGCDIDAVNKYAKKAIDLARFKRNEKIIKMLSDTKNVPVEIKSLTIKSSGR